MACQSLLVVKESPSVAGEERGCLAIGEYLEQPRNIALEQVNVPVTSLEKRKFNMSWDTVSRIIRLMSIRLSQ